MHTNKRKSCKEITHSLLTDFPSNFIFMIKLERSIIYFEGSQVTVFKSIKFLNLRIVFMLPNFANPVNILANSIYQDEISHSETSFLMLLCVISVFLFMINFSKIYSFCFSAILFFFLS